LDEEETLKLDLYGRSFSGILLLDNLAHCSIAAEICCKTNRRPSTAAWLCLSFFFNFTVQRMFARLVDDAVPESITVFQPSTPSVRLECFDPSVPPTPE